MKHQNYIKSGHGQHSNFENKNVQEVKVTARNKAGGNTEMWMGKYLINISLWVMIF